MSFLARFTIGMRHTESWIFRLEQALRNFTCLTQGDLIEISYNSIIFGLLVMEASPGGEGISVLDTDLEVDFAAPVGYVEPERPKPAPPSTMASRLGIDLNSNTPGSSRPGSSLSGGFAGAGSGGTTVSKGGDQWETFKGKGETLGGRKTKGRGISHRGVEQVSEDSKIIRTEYVRFLSLVWDSIDSRCHPVNTRSSRMTVSNQMSRSLHHLIYPSASYSLDSR